MSGFAPEWLAKREAADQGARSQLVLQETRRWAERRAAGSNTLRVLDLGAGTGANLRCLVPYLPCPQTWTLVDDDRRLLASPVFDGKCGPITPMLRTGALRVRAIEQDLASTSLEELLCGAELITASALFDLVSEAWCRRLVRYIARPGAALLAALTYDGRVVLDPVHPFDPTIRALFNRHQRRNKGFGPALGPAAARTVARLAAAAGARVVVARSDWRLGRSETALLQTLLREWATAASEIEPEQTCAVESWAALRLEQTRAGLLSVVVGHLDVLAIWPGKPRR